MSVFHMQGDTDATATLQKLEQHHRATLAGVERQRSLYSLCAETATLHALLHQKIAFRGAWVLCVEEHVLKT